MANLYGLKKFDLNLLVIFECIYQHLSISRAAETLFITPSAVSQSLQRLRNQLNDPLFIRCGKGITPTTVGINLHYQLEKSLHQLEQMINLSHDSDLTTRFVIYSPQLFMSPESTRLIQAIYQIPNLQVEHHELQLSAGSVESLLSYRKADLILSLSPLSHPETVCQPFHEVRMALVCRQHHPRAALLTSSEAIVQEGFTCYLTNEPGVKAFHSQIKKLFPARTIAFRSDSLIAILNMINQTDLIGFIPETVCRHPFFNRGLKVLPLNIPLPSLMIYLIYHHTQMGSPVFASLIEKITIS
ncbi:DNA-binding transcriptional LysR family regulator [Raoultella sp. BIGb0138]|uniref:DNA-binding transcriptional repressor CitR n=1 Tax=Raoultella sp. BIGb0138 TaxID=2485115 RepID=UPI00104E793E|nr:LysR family transcriptional regulator [Raoultella sp. BIGb0138]TCW15430.1 DNA-binding transcriptional LysR family regulator [Raoultella sp. BIGb0138]